MNATPDMMTVGFKMLGALGLVLALVLFLLYGVRRLSGQRLGAGSGKRIQVLENHYLGVKKTISLVRVPGKVLVLGIAGDRINLLDRLDDDVVESSPSMAAPSSFGPVLSTQLKKLGNGLKGKDKK